MSNNLRKDQVGRVLAPGFQLVCILTQMSEYEIQQKAFWNNYERLKAERLAREAAKPKEK